MKRFTEIRRKVDIRLFSDNPFQYRNGYEGIEELAQSIEKQGLLQPMVVRLIPLLRKGIRSQKQYLEKIESALGTTQDTPSFELAFGHRRTRALLHLAKKSNAYQVEVIIRDLSDAQMGEIALSENSQREAIHPYHTARLVQKLLGVNKGRIDLVAERLGKSPQWVAQHRAYLDLTEELASAWLSGIIQLGHVNILIRYSGEIQQEVYEKFTQVEKEWDRSQGEWVEYGRIFDCSVAKLKKICESKLNRSLEDACFDPTDTQLVPAAGSCTDCLYNAMANQLLFEELNEKGGLCTRPTCFQEKQKAQLLKILKQKKEAGHTVFLITKSYYGDSDLDYGAEIFGSEAYHSPGKAQADGVGIYCDPSEKEFLQEIEIWWGKRKAVHAQEDGTLQGVLDMKLERRKSRRDTEVWKEKKKARYQTACVLSEEEGMSKNLLQMQFQGLWAWISSEDREAFLSYMKLKWKKAIIEKIESSYSSKKWIASLSEKDLQKGIKLMLLLGAVHSYSYQKVLDREDKKSVFTQKQKALEKVRLEKWARQDEALEKERQKIDHKMEQVQKWIDTPDSWYHKTVHIQDWKELQKLQKTSPKLARKIIRAMGVKIKTGSTLEEIVEAVKAHHPIFQESFLRWQKEQKRKSKTTVEPSA